MELLAKLLGGIERVKIMRFFLHNTENTFSLNHICEKTKVKSAICRKEMATLVSIGFIERKKYTTTILGKTKKDTKVKETISYKLNQNFPHNQALSDLLFDFELLDKRELASRFKNIGRIKLFLVSGVFINNPKSRVDVLIVGEAINKAKADKIFDILSSELGREVIYSMMDIEEFEYRYKMYDKFVRDILDTPHESVIDKISAKHLF